MHVTMVKKRLASGEPCPKCIKAEELLRQRGLWSRVDEVVWALEVDPGSPGMRLAKELGVAAAPFFVVDDETGRRVHTSVLGFVAKELEAKDDAPPSVSAGVAPDDAEVEALARELEAQGPEEALRRALGRFGAGCTIAFSGAEDVVLIDMASRLRLPFSVFSLDTGRLHPETLRFLEQVRKAYGVAIRVVAPDAVAVEALVRAKGLFSFYDDGHAECCGIRKVEPLARALRGSRAWVTGQRRDQSPSTRGEVAVAELDHAHADAVGPLLKLNPLAAWTQADVWRYVREHDVPYNELHERGFVSIGCEPCTRAVRPGEHERAGRFFWEDATKRECGLHLAK